MSGRVKQPPKPVADLELVTLNPTLFERWWQTRGFANDREIMDAAVSAGLVRRGSAGGLIWLTKEGSELRDAGIRARSATRAAAEGGV